MQASADRSWLNRLGDSPQWSAFTSALGSVNFWWMICLFCAGVLAADTRHKMNPDGLSYVDVATEALNGGPGKLLNGYWSLGYPALISATLFVVRPSPDYEFPAVHFLNFLIFVFCLWAFTRFFRSWREIVQGGSVDQQGFLTPFAFCTFLYFVLKLIGTTTVTPDLMVAGIVFLAASITCRLSLSGGSWRRYAALGLVLGLGYYVKAAVFPLSLAFLVILFLYPPSASIPRRMLLLSVAVFLLVAAPLVAALSARTGRITFGETGKLNYAWYVNGLHWTDGLEKPEPNWTTEHPAPKLLEKPLTLSFASPVPGTYPLWFDPSYWYGDVKVKFQWRNQIAAIQTALRDYKETVSEMLVFLAGALVLLGFLHSDRECLTVLRNLWPIFAWPLAALAMYALVHVENRFLGAFFVLLWLGLYGPLLGQQDNRQVQIAVCATAILTVLLPFTGTVVKATGNLAQSLIHSRTPDYQQTAAALKNLGLRSGDRLAVVGYAYNCYYARNARMQVVAQIPDVQEFWRLGAQEQQAVSEKLALAGVNAIVAFDRPAGAEAGGWKDFTLSDSLRLSVWILPPKAK